MTSMININRDLEDAYFRYKMPALLISVQGRGNGIKTVLLNLPDISRALDRPPKTIMKYFGIKLGAQTTVALKEERFMLNGSHTVQKLQDILDGYIQQFVLCKSCGNPETGLTPKGKYIVVKCCKACGHSSPVHNDKLFGSCYSYGDARAENALIGDGECAAGDKNKSAKVLSAERKSRCSKRSWNDQELEDWYKEMLRLEIQSGSFTPDRSKLFQGASATDEELQDFIELCKSILVEKDDYSRCDIRTIIQEAEAINIRDKAIAIVFELLFDNPAQFLRIVAKHKPLLFVLVNERPDSQRNLLRTLDLYMRETPKLLPQTPKILQYLYNEDLIEEDIFLEYFPERKRNRNEFRLRAVRFIDWLVYAPVEEEEEAVPAPPISEQNARRPQVSAQTKVNERHVNTVQREDGNDDDLENEKEIVEEIQEEDKEYEDEVEDEENEEEEEEDIAGDEDEDDEESYQTIYSHQKSKKHSPFYLDGFGHVCQSRQSCSWAE